MNLPEADQNFLRELVKTSRQRPHHVRWKDRDGSERVTTLSPSDVVRANTLAHQLGIGKDELFRQAAHLPAAPRATAQPDPERPGTP